MIEIPDDILAQLKEEALKLTNGSLVFGTNLTSSIFGDLLYPQSNSPNILRYMNLYVVPIVVVSGLVGNLVSFVVFVSRYMQRISSNVYLAALSIADIGFLISVLFFWLQSSFDQIDFYSVTGLCQTFTYVTYMSSFLSVWYVVSFTIERYIAVQFPLQRHVLCTTRRAKLVVSGLALFAAVLYNYGAWTSDVMTMTSDGYKICAPLPSFDSFVAIAQSIDTVITLILPFFVISILNVRIAYTVVNFYRTRESRGAAIKTSVSPASGDRRSHHRVNRNPPSRSTVGFRSANRDAQPVKTHQQLRVTKLVLIVSGVFLALNLPRHVTRTYAFVLSTFFGQFLPSPSFLVCERLFEMVYYLHYSVNIILYSTIGGNNFRRALGRILARSKRLLLRLSMSIRIHICCILFCCFRRNPKSTTAAAAAAVDADQKMMPRDEDVAAVQDDFLQMGADKCWNRLARDELSLVEICRNRAEVSWNRRRFSQIEAENFN